MQNKLKCVHSYLRPYIWGKEAVTQHSARKALGRTLWKQPSVEDVLKLLDAKALYDSMLKFPLDQPLHVCYISSPSMLSMSGGGWFVVHVISECPREETNN